VTRIEGINTPTALTIISETGIDMNKWPTDNHFASWLALCPGTKISGRKVLSSKSRPCANHAAHAFRLAAYSLHKSNSALGAFLRSKKSHLGSPKAITATVQISLPVYFTICLKQVLNMLILDNTITNEVTKTASLQI